MSDNETKNEGANGVRWLAKPISRLWIGVGTLSGVAATAVYQWLAPKETGASMLVRALSSIIAVLAALSLALALSYLRLWLSNRKFPRFSVLWSMKGEPYCPVKNCETPLGPYLGSSFQCPTCKRNFPLVKHFSGQNLTTFDAVNLVRKELGLPLNEL